MMMVSKQGVEREQERSVCRRREGGQSVMTAVFIGGAPFVYRPPYMQEYTAVYCKYSKEAPLVNRPPAPLMQEYTAGEILLHE